MLFGGAGVDLCSLVLAHDGSQKPADVLADARSGQRRTLEFVDAVVTLDDLTGRLHDEALRVAHAHGVRSIAVFGSVARGDASSGSDVDFLVDFEAGRSLLDLLRLTDDLEALLVSCQLEAPRYSVPLMAAQ